jgi:hypothetical protein
MLTQHSIWLILLIEEVFKGGEYGQESLQFQKSF